MQQSQRRNRQRPRTLHSADTDPALPRVTLPIPAYYLPDSRQPWHRRLALGLNQALVFVVRKIVLLLNFSLTLLLLLLFVRFLLVAFSLHSSLFVNWIFQLSAPLLLPFNNLLPLLPYRGLLIDTNTLIAILAYTIAVKLLTSFLHSLAGSAKRKA
jgi:uncharacterized protein YggT (Ycf19 family)